MSEQRDWFTDPAVSIWAQPWFREKMSEQQAPYATTAPVNPRPWSWWPYPIGSLTPHGYLVHMRGRRLCLTPLPMFVDRPYQPRYPKSDNSLHARRRRGRR